MELISRADKKPTPAQIARRQAIASFLAVVVLAGGAKMISEAGGSPKEQDEMAITIGPNGTFPSLPAAVLAIAAKNPQLGREDIRVMLARKVETQLQDHGIEQEEYNQFQPQEDVTVEVPDWGFGTLVQENIPPSP